MKNSFHATYVYDKRHKYVHNGIRCVCVRINGMNEISYEPTDSFCFSLFAPFSTTKIWKCDFSSMTNQQKIILIKKQIQWIRRESTISRKMDYSVVDRSFFQFFAFDSISFWNIENKRIWKQQQQPNDRNENKAHIDNWSNPFDMHVCFFLASVCTAAAAQKALVYF